jgi:hypothetical protein
MSFDSANAGAPANRVDASRGTRETLIHAVAPMSLGFRAQHQLGVRASGADLARFRGD